jgi:arylsulfatase A
MFLTDNGGTAGVKIFNAGMRGGKTSVHEGGCRVPLFVHWPARFSQPRVIKQLASHIDIYPTVLDLCGITPPQGLPVDGVSLRPLLEGRDSSWPERVLFTHNPISETNRYPGAVRTSKYRLVREIKGPQGGSSAKSSDDNAPAWQLYDMQNDPGEKQNLAQDRPQVVAELSQLYEAWIEDTRKPGLERLPIPIGYAEENPVTVNAPQAFLSGNLRFDHGPGFAHDWITDWSDTTAAIEFDLDVVRSGSYDIAIQYATKKPAGETRLRIPGLKTRPLFARLSPQQAPVIPLPHRDERSRERYVNRQWPTRSLLTIELPKGRVRLRLQAADLPDGQSLDFKGLRINRTEEKASQ